MSLLSQLKKAPGSSRNMKRIGRGGTRGQTSGKGDKGQKARTGGKIRRGFEGGQMPLHRRLPKFGFSNKDFETKYLIVNIGQLENFASEVTPEALKEAKLVKGRGLVKVLSKGKLTKALTVKAHKFSEKAKSAIEAAGGKVEVIK